MNSKEEKELVKAEEAVEDIKEENENPLVEEISALKEERIRLLADIENERKNHFREVEKVVKYANRRFLVKFLPLLENYQRALKSNEEHNNESAGKLFSGLSMVLEELKNNLKNEGVEDYSPILRGEVWDSNFCEVIDEIENDDYETGTVMEVVQKGYLLHDKVLVTAKIIVSKKGQAS